MVDISIWVVGTDHGTSKITQGDVTEKQSSPGLESEVVQYFEFWGKQRRLKRRQREEESQGSVEPEKGKC